MKQLITSSLLILLITATVYGQSGWFWQNPLPQGNTLYDVEFIGNGIAIACGDAGTILRTTNNGTSWIAINNDSGVVNKSVDFFNSNTGWMISTFNGASRINKTTNAGLNWNEIAIIGGADAYKVKFVSIDTGYASVRGSTGSYVYKTTNSGNNWNSVFYNSGSYIYSTYFINNSTGFVCGSFGISKTTNSGINWVNKYSVSVPSQYTAKNIHFIDANTGIAVGQYSMILSPPFGRTLKTTNAGENWVVVYEGINNSRFEDLDFVNNTTGFICGSGISKSTNNGSNWLSIQSSGFNFRSIDILLSNGLIVGDFGIMLQSINSGEDWINNFSSYRGGGISSLYFSNKMTGYAVSGKNVLITTNAGLNWNVNVTPASYNLSCLGYIDSNYIFAAGGHDTYSSMIKTTNGGENWNILNTGISRTINSMFFLNKDTGFCCGSYNGVQKTTNGGLNWMYTPIDGLLHKIQFVNNNTGYIVGWSNSYKTTNSGINWVPISTSGETAFFINSNTGFAAGIGMRIQKTTNGGLNWVTQTQYGLWRIYGIHLLNDMLGFASGDFGAILKTTNGGANWLYQQSPTNYLLSSVFITDTNECYISGYSNTILKTTNGGNIIGINNMHQNFPHSFLLKQNYPNPFNPQTKIKFNVPKASFTKIIIYDLLGREVATLVNKELRPGTYEAEWDASSFSSGVYFYRIISGEFVITKKMVLLK